MNVGDSGNDLKKKAATPAVVVGAFPTMRKQTWNTGDATKKQDEAPLGELPSCFLNRTLGEPEVEEEPVTATADRP